MKARSEASIKFLGSQCILYKKRQHTQSRVSLHQSLLSHHIRSTHPIRKLLPFSLETSQLTISSNTRAIAIATAQDQISIRRIPQKQERKLTRTSQNPYFSSKPIYGFRAPPSRSISPAQSRQLIGLSFSAPSTIPIETMTTATSASMMISCGKASRVLLKRTVCSWAE